MLKEALGISAMVLCGVCCGGCDGSAQQPAEHDYPSVPPLWIVEDDPKLTVYDRKDLERDRAIRKMLVIPLYRDYQHDGENDFLAIAHPFVYQQGKDIETRLASIGQRDKLRMLILWVPGYFPDGLGPTFRWVPTINGQDMVVVELQPCLGAEESQINTAMKALLEGDFIVGEGVYLKAPPPPYTHEPKMTEERYDAARLVRSTGYSGRFYDHQAARNMHLLWTYPVGTRIVNRLTPEEKKIVAAFAANEAEGGTGGGREPGDASRSVKE